MPRYGRKRFRWKRLGAAAFLLVAAIFGLYFYGEMESALDIGADPLKIRLYDTGNNKLLELGLEEYLVGVVAAEMPASFPPGALEAQAVAARTYALRRMQAPDPRVKALHREADLCTDPALNQAWISQAEMRRRWGSLDYTAYRRKIIQAVVRTKGIILTYGGRLIDPVYHSSCGGVGTENSEDVWKFPIPYLRRVECTGHRDPHGGEVTVVALRRLDEIFGTGLEALPAGKITAAGTGIRVKERTPSGRIKSLSLGAKTLTGTELRSRLGLYSTRLEWQVSGDAVRFTSRGYGHGVGMCQYGAASLAEEGRSYEEILTYYYTGVQLGRYSLR